MFDDAELAANRRGQLGLAQRRRLEQTRRTWQTSERLLQWVVRISYAGLAGFGLFGLGCALVLVDASYLLGTLLCAVSAVLTWKLFGTSVRVQHPPVPEQVISVSGYVESFTKSYGGDGLELHFVRVRAQLRGHDGRARRLSAWSAVPALLRRLSTGIFGEIAGLEPWTQRQRHFAVGRDRRMSVIARDSGPCSRVQSHAR